MIYNLTIEGETPAKKNSRINTKSGRSFPSVRYQQWHQSAIMQIKMQRIKPVTKPCSIELIFVHGDNRRRDSDNGTSSIFDTLVDAGILKDDSWQYVPELKVKNIYEKNNAKCLISIIETD